MEQVSCNLCGSRDQSRVILGRDRLMKLGDSFQVVRCRRCRLAYLNPRPTAAELSAHYPNEYNAFVRDYVHHRPRGLMKVGADMITRRRIPRSAAAGRALEIGSGGAAYLLALRERGWEVHGVEVSAELAQHARETFGLDVRTGPAETQLLAFPDNHFDLVAMWHVLEHLSDPAAVLTQIRRILKPGGRLMLELPNFTGVSRFLFRTYWMALDLPRHLYHFTPATLETMLARAGFCDIVIRGVPAALVVTTSLQLFWNDWRGVTSARIISSRSLLVALFFGSALLARLRLSAHMAAEADKPLAAHSPRG
ncbi:MAG: hypothetical protein DMF87_19025 [Acidobacteria bacterium]|nr:MAG: hypothetical protein DMF88_14080 [Acidobacteriota bacterium]PYR76010.1 MAG: hypothetical protein DMF87_19025 [Acidobacteriota bacterium]